MTRYFPILAVLFANNVLSATMPPVADAYNPPAKPATAGGPLVYEHSGEAGPDETFFLVGENLTGELTAWGQGVDSITGQEYKPRTQFLDKNYLAATIPERAQDGPFLVWIKNTTGWSAPIILNAPAPWWCGPDIAFPGDTVRIFGRNLSRRPDHVAAFVYIVSDAGKGAWVKILRAGKYNVSFQIPENVEPGNYMVFVYAGIGGDCGWSKPVNLRIERSKKNPRVIRMKKNSTGNDIQRTLDSAAGRNIVVNLPAGTFSFSGTIRIPAGTCLTGAGKELTKLQITRDPTVNFPRLGGIGWNEAPGAIHSIGDTIEYEVTFPRAGNWSVWLRYATEMSTWKQPGVSGNMTLDAGYGAVPLENLPNTGGFGVFKWSKSAEIRLSAGKQKLIWKNIKGGGITLDALVFTQDPSFTPSDTPFPQATDRVIVQQGEDTRKFINKEGKLSIGDRAAVWLSGDGAGVTDLSILGNPQVNIGILIKSPENTKWTSDCRIERVHVADNEGKQAENCGLRARYAERAIVRDNELTGRTPLFLSGVRRCDFSRNQLVSQTRFGGNAEAAILGRNETVEQCIIEDNVVASPPGTEAGGPTARRLVWLSTGHGSITHNWIAGNGVETHGAPLAGQARFGGVAGTDQNVGEMILFEGNHRTAYFGPLYDADSQSVSLPKNIPATPDERLGNVKREQLAHDSTGMETPFWPPDIDDNSQEPPIGEYYVTIFSGRGQGQTRRVIRREGERLLLDKPWRVAPVKGSVVAVATAFYRNLIVGNRVEDGMTGVQLWISCIENIVSANTIARQRKPGLFLYANGTTLASSMPRTWNRGISPLFWNICEVNRSDECSVGALVTSGDSGNLPVEFPRALGNVLRHNSFIRSRADGIVMTSRKAPSTVKDTSASIVGTIVEFNVVRDAPVAYHVNHNTDDVVLRRNHAYFWYPVNNSTNIPVAIQVADTNAIVSIEENSIEGIHGGHDNAVIDFKSPAGTKRLPE